MQAKPVESHGCGLRVELRKVEHVQCDPRVGKRHVLAVRSDHYAALGQPAGSERLGLARLSRTVVLHNIEEGLQARLHAGVGGMRIDFECQIGL